MLAHILYMEALYSGIYESEENWKQYQQTRKIPHMYYRHIVRYLTYNRGEVSLNYAAQVEAKVLETSPVRHDTILHSLETVEDTLKGTEYFRKVLRVKENLDINRYNNAYQYVVDDYKTLAPIYQQQVFINLLSRGSVKWTQARSEIQRLQQNIKFKPNAPVEQTITYTEDQKAALESITEWLDDPDSLYKTLSGYAGTGKTTLLDKIVEIAQTKMRGIIVTATTNKAVKVLVDRVNAPSYATIHSVLNIKPKRKGTKEVFEPDKYTGTMSLADYKLVIVDECSMISKELLEIIYNENMGHTKVLFCGDPAQLQPVGEQDISKCFDFDTAMLSEVVRHGDNIANKAKLVRSNASSVSKEQLLIDPEIQLIQKREIWELFKGFRDDPDRVRMLCWTNSQVDYWNHLLRLADYGEPTEHPFVAGDIVIANKPCLEGKNVVMMNSEEGVVTTVHDTESHYKLGVRLQNGDDVKVRVVKDDYKEALSDQLKLYAESYEWHKYWELKKYYHDIKHCYALTTHKSQGSTFGSIVMDWGNMQANRDIENRNQLIYVAMTRAAHQVLIF